MSTAMRRTTRLAAGCLLLSALTASADQASDQLFARLDGNADQVLDPTEVDAEHRRLFDRLLRRADQDGDGRLTPAEFAAGLTPSEPPKPIVDEPVDANPGADALRLLLLKLDANRDGMLTKAEAPTQLADAYDQLARVVDQDDNNIIIYRELIQAARPATQAAVRIARSERWDVQRELKRIAAEQGDDAKRFDSAPNRRDALASGPRMEDLFKQLDANGDGRLEPAELPEQYRDQLERLVRAADRDNSGDVTLTEFQSQARRAARLLALTESRQRDKSDAGQMDDAMMMGADAPDNRAPRRQADGPAPTKPGAAQPDPRRVVAAMDRNGDGMIQASEATGALQRRFERLDANADGQLDPRELRRAARQLQRGRTDRLRERGDARP